MSQLFDRMLRAVRLDPALYEEVEADAGSMSQAAIVVVLSSLAAGVGTMVAARAAGLVIGTVAALIGWVAWAAICYFVGTKVLPEKNTKADLGELMRTLGFASAPGVIRFAGIIPGLAAPVALIAAFWMLAAMVVAVRQALDYESTGRAVGVCLIGFVLQAILIMAFLRPMLAL